MVVIGINDLDYLIKKQSTPFPVDMLCSRCNDLPLGSNWPTERYPTLSYGGPFTHHSDYEHLLLASKSCRICKGLIERLKGEKPSASSDALTTFEYCPSGDDTGNPLSHQISFKFSDNSLPQLHFYLIHEYWLDIEGVTWMTENQFEPTTVSERSLGWLKERTQDCTSSHETCDWLKKWSPPSFLPSRVIDLFGAGSGSYQIIDTNEQAGLGDSGYAALSYMWGRASFLSLNESTKERLYGSRNPVSELPQAFREAVAVTLALGLRYLWIDSLCIQQDSSQDWEKEAARMGDAYVNCRVNIAICSANPHESFMLNRDWDDIRPCVISDLNWLDYPEGDNVLVPVDFAEHEIESMPLMHRGWVLQERYLSARTIYFTPKQVFWECRQLVACEALPDGIPTAYFYLGTAPSTKRFGPEENKDNLVENFELLDFWNQRIYDYSDCGLTVASDRLPAVSGIATYIQRMTGDRYLAGLWLSRLPSSLCWSTRRSITDQGPGGAQGVRSARLSIPSWSWASTSSPVGLALGEARPERCIARITNVLKRNDRLSFVPEPHNWSLEIESLVFPVKIESTNGEIIEGIRRESLYIGSQPFQVSVSWDDLPVNSQDPHCLIIEAFSQRIRKPKHAELSTKLSAILIEPTDLAGTFSRLGNITVPLSHAEYLCRAIGIALEGDDDNLLPKLTETAMQYTRTIILV